MEGIFANLPKRQPIRKTPREYLAQEEHRVKAWKTSVKRHCPQAERFEQMTLAALANQVPSTG